MKPIKITCPICKKEMIASSWGMRRCIIEILGGKIPGDIVNYVDYECSCGCKIIYSGTRSCWK